MERMTDHRSRKRIHRKRDIMRKRSFCIAGICGALFLLLIVLLKTVDVTASGAAGTYIGLSTINTGFNDLTGVIMTLYKITDVLGYVSIATVGIFGILGLVQWIKRKHILKVDREILAMGIMFIIMLLIYIFFEKVIINYRPILMPGCTEPEASFPSSHTGLTLIVLGSIFMVIDKYVKNQGLSTAIRIVAAIIMVFMVIGRLICGVHWLTDIIGAILISTVLLALYYAEKS